MPGRRRFKAFSKPPTQTLLSSHSWEVYNSRFNTLSLSILIRSVHSENQRLNFLEKINTPGKEIMQSPIPSVKMTQEFSEEEALITQKRWSHGAISLAILYIKDSY